jgi:predicted DsbA family dithiol-disulfide isomerase
MCPFCYLAFAYIKELKKTRDLDVEWINYELHPDTPIEGILLVDRFGEEKTKGFIEEIKKMGNPYGLKFGELYFMPNSRLILEASEYAKESGKFECFHQKVFYEHFVNLVDIGKKDVVKSLAADCGIDEKVLMERLAGGYYTERIKRIHEMAKNSGVGKTPYFVIEDKYFLERPSSIDDIIDVLKQTGKECG